MFLLRMVTRNRLTRVLGRTFEYRLAKFMLEKSVKIKKNTIFHVRDISPLKEAIETVERNPDIM